MLFEQSKEQQAGASTHSSEPLVCSVHLPIGYLLALDISFFSTATVWNAEDGGVGNVEGNKTS
jgi:hypothetical protein